MSTTKPTAADPEFWHNKWKTGDIRFHQADVHPDLLQFFSEKGARNVFVPMCGKSLDMLWLAKEGHHVTGVELSPLACEAFFVENKIPFEKTLRGVFEVYEGAGIQIWNGDFFSLPDAVWKKTDFVYDRAAIVALPIDLRKKYAATFVEKTPRATLMLISVEYDQSKAEGPAFSISEEEIRSLYGNTFRIEKLLTKENPSVYKTNPKFDGVDVKEVTYRLVGRIKGP